METSPGAEAEPEEPPKGPEGPTGPGAGHPAGDQRPPDEGRDPLRFDNWRRRSAAGAVLTGIARGLHQALEPPRKESAIVIQARDDPDDPDGPIELRFDPDSPADTVAVIRRPADPDPGGSQPPP
ncbi:MAG: hypothetical protein ACLQPH_21685 [Acidimicrobiales bacterium]